MIDIATRSHEQTDRLLQLSREWHDKKLAAQGVTWIQYRDARLAGTWTDKDGG